MTNKYDDPTFDSIQFMLEVIHEPTAPLPARMEAAKFLISVGMGDLYTTRPPAVVYRFADYKEPDDASTAA